MLNMSGKVVFIAGAGSIGEGWGNGKATAVLMARQGARVFGVDRDEAAIEGTRTAMLAGNLTDWSFRKCDMTDSEQVASAVQECLDKMGRIDVLVNNVGGSAPGDPVTMSEQAWDAQMDLNLKTAFLGCKHVLPVMERQFEQDGSVGAVVNVSSIGCMTFQMGGRVSVGYAASKAGIMAFSRSLGIAYARKGIRVNTVVPGTMHTPLVESRLVKQLGVTDTEAFVARRHASVPIGRMGDAWDVANAVLFLASNEAGYITATQLVVDGGLTAARPAI
ncbi:Short chain dehydrogenase [Bordetella tumbae]